MAFHQVFDLLRIKEMIQPTFFQGSPNLILLEGRGIHARAEGSLFFHDGPDAFVALHRDGHREVWAVRSPNYRRWLSRRYWETQARKVPNSDALGSALNVLEGFSFFDGQAFALSNRVGWAEGHLWYDLANERCQASCSRRMASMKEGS